MRDGASLRKLTIHLSLILQTGLDYLEGLSVFELIDIAKEVSEAYGSR